MSTYIILEIISVIVSLVSILFIILYYKRKNLNSHKTNSDMQKTYFVVTDYKSRFICKTNEMSIDILTQRNVTNGTYYFHKYTSDGKYLCMYYINFYPLDYTKPKNNTFIYNDAKIEKKYPKDFNLESDSSLPYITKSLFKSSKKTHFKQLQKFLFHMANTCS